MENKAFERFIKKKQKRQIKESFRVEKIIQRKGMYSEWKGYDNSLKCCIDKKILLHKMSYFPELYTRSEYNINF